MISRLQTSERVLWLGFTLCCTSACGRLGFDYLDEAATVDAAVAEILPLPEYAWSLPLSADGIQRLNGIDVDGAGNIYIVGTTTDSIDLGGGVLGSIGGEDNFVVSYDPDGNHRWSELFGSPVDDLVFDVAADEAGNVYVTGQFEQSISPGGGQLNSTGDVDIFLVSYDTDGALRWAQSFGDASGGDTGRALATDSQGNLHLTGWVNGSVDFGAGSVATENQDVPILSFDSSGGLQRSFMLGGPSVDQGQSIAVDAGGAVYVTGNFDTSIDLGDGQVQSGGARDLFAVALAPSGSPGWSLATGAGGREEGSAIAVSAAGDCYVGGLFDSSLNFGAGDETASAGDDAFIASFDSEGSRRWSRVFGGIGDDHVQSLQVASDQTVLATGIFDDSVDFGGQTLDSIGQSDAFVALYHPDGELLWAKNFGGDFNDVLHDAAIAPDDSIYVIGKFSGSPDFGDGPWTTNQADGAVIKFTR